MVEQALIDEKKTMLVFTIYNDKEKNIYVYEKYIQKYIQRKII